MQLTFHATNRDESRVFASVFSLDNMLYYMLYVILHFICYIPRTVHAKPHVYRNVNVGISSKYLYKFLISINT